MTSKNLEIIFLILILFGALAYWETENKKCITKSGVLTRSGCVKKEFFVE